MDNVMAIQQTLNAERKRAIDSEIVVFSERRDSTPTPFWDLGCVHVYDWSWKEFWSSLFEVAHTFLLAIVGFVVLFMFVFVWCCV
jgi:hypothetical protein